MTHPSEWSGEWTEGPESEEYSDEEDELVASKLTVGELLASEQLAYSEEATRLQKQSEASPAARPQDEGGGISTFVHTQNSENPNAGATQNSNASAGSVSESNVNNDQLVSRMEQELKSTRGALALIHVEEQWRVEIRRAIQIIGLVDAAQNRRESEFEWLKTQTEQHH